MIFTMVSNPKEVQQQVSLDTRHSGSVVFNEQSPKRHILPLPKGIVFGTLVESSLR